MKEKAGVVRGWLRKAASNVVTLGAALAAGAFDGAFFHAQQAAEKYLKGFLTFHDRPFPYTNNFGRPSRTLRRDCAGVSQAQTLRCPVDMVCGSTAAR
jgi:HEPN domain-containing protein